jgi:hypothetical protein
MPSFGPYYLIIRCSAGASAWQQIAARNNELNSEMLALSRRVFIVLIIKLGGKCEIHTMEFAIALLNRILIVWKVQLVWKLDFHTIFSWDLYLHYFRGEEFEKYLLRRR